MFINYIKICASIPVAVWMLNAFSSVEDTLSVKVTRLEDFATKQALRIQYTSDHNSVCTYRKISILYASVAQKIEIYYRYGNNSMAIIHSLYTK